MKVLVVEDNLINMQFVSELLKRAGYKVLEAMEADTGIVLAREEQPALILMDIQLPGMDGLTAVRLLKGDDKTRHIKIIAVTAFAMKGDRERMEDAGCDGYVPKPIRYKEFLETVKSVLGE